MAKEEIANVKAKSLLQLVEKLGRDMSGFNHTLMGSQRDMLLLLGEMIQKEVPYLFDYKPISAISRDPKL